MLYKTILQWLQQEYKKLFLLRKKIIHLLHHLEKIRLIAMMFPTLHGSPTESQLAVWNHLQTQLYIHTHIHTHTHTHTHNHTYTHRQTHTQTNTYADIYLLVVRERSIYLWEENVKRLKVNTSFHSYNPAGNDMFKVNNRNTKTRYKLYSKLEIKTPERHQVSLLLTLNKFQTFF